MSFINIKSKAKTGFFVCALMSLGLGAMSASAFAAPDYGNCHVTGQRGSVKLTTITPDTLTVRPYMPSPGFWNGDSYSTVKDGFEYCLAANIAYRAGLDRIKLVSVSFAQLLAGQTNTFDIALSQISVTKEREKVVNFTVPYYHISTAVMVQTGTKIDEKSIRNMRLGAENGTTQLQFINEDIKPTKPIRVFNDAATMYAALTSGQVDAIVYDLGSLLTAAKHSQGRFVVAGQYTTGKSASYPVGGLVNKSSPNLAAFNTLITGLKQDGTIDRLIKEYLVPSFSVPPSSVPVWSL